VFGTIGAKPAWKASLRTSVSLCLRCAVPTGFYDLNRRYTPTRRTPFCFSTFARVFSTFPSSQQLSGTAKDVNRNRPPPPGPADLLCNLPSNHHGAELLYALIPPLPPPKDGFNTSPIRRFPTKLTPGDAHEPQLCGHPIRILKSWWISFPPIPHTLMPVDGGAHSKWSSGGRPIFHTRPLGTETAPSESKRPQMASMPLHFFFLHPSALGLLLQFGSVAVQN